MRFPPALQLVTPAFAITLCAISARAEHSAGSFPDDREQPTKLVAPRTLTPSLPQASSQAAGQETTGPTSLGVASQREADADARAEKRRRAWMLSLEGVTHAPVDMGAQVGVETPQGLRLFAGYGWVPGGYMNLLTGVAASASGNGYAETLLNDGHYSGHTWRIQAGWRPFRAIGLYGDVGYARLNANGSLDLASSSVPQLAMFGGGYEASTRLDMWLFELGYQGEIADRLVLALALGAMGTFSATTKITAVNGAPTNNAILNSAASEADTALEKYGIVPTLTLRLGFDLI